MFIFAQRNKAAKFLLGINAVQHLSVTNSSKYTTRILQKPKKSESRLVGEGIAKRRRSYDAITCHVYTFLL
jgi:hypothetical protein